MDGGVYCRICAHRRRLVPLHRRHLVRCDRKSAAAARQRVDERAAFRHAARREFGATRFPLPLASRCNEPAFTCSSRIGPHFDCSPPPINTIGARAFRVCAVCSASSAPRAFRSALTRTAKCCKWRRRRVWCAVKTANANCSYYVQQRHFQRNEFELNKNDGVYLNGAEVRRRQRRLWRSRQRFQYFETLSSHVHSFHNLMYREMTLYHMLIYGIESR